MSDNEMIHKHTWEDFRQNGLLWWANRFLHIFGWAIVFEYEENKVTDVYPARVKFRGFDESAESHGFTSLTDWLKDNIDELQKEPYL